MNFNESQSEYDLNNKKNTNIQSTLNDNESGYDCKIYSNDSIIIGNIKKISSTNFVINTSGIGLYCTLIILIALTSLDLYIT